MKLHAIYEAAAGRMTGSVLAIETDDLTARAAVLRKAGNGSLNVVAFCESAEANLDAALVDILSKLRSQSVAVPTQALLLSPHLHTTVLQLPVDPAKPLPRERMHELVKWELEPYLARGKARRIGAILVGRGFMHADDLERLLQTLEVKTVGTRKTMRLGAAAMQAGMVTRQQLDECLAMQKAMQSFDGSAACGWISLGETPVDGKWRWLVTGTVEGYRRYLIDLFSEYGLQLRAVYPLVGSAAASLNGNGGRSSAIFEYQSGYLGFTRLAGKNVATSRSVLIDHVREGVQQCVGLFEREAETVWLAGRWPDIEASARELGTQLARPCSPLPVSVVSGKLPPSGAASLAGMAGAATNYLLRPYRNSAVHVPARDPKRALVLNPWFLAGVASVTLAAALGWRGLDLSRQDREANGLLDARQAMETKARAVGDLRTQLRQNQEALDLLEHVLPDRRKAASGVLQALSTCCVDGVMIKRIHGSPTEAITLQAWGLTPTQVQQFKIRIQSALPNLAVVDTQPIRQERGWQGLPGYGFEVKLVVRDVASGGPKP